MIRSLFFALVLGFPVTTMAQTYAFIEAQTQVEHDLKPQAAVNALVGHRYGEWGVSGFFMVADGWGQAYLGPTYAPASWVELSLSVGAQQTDKGLGLRYAASIWFGYDRFEFLGIVEFDNWSFKGDDSGVWYDLTMSGKVTNWFAAGFKDRRWAGFGPYLKFVHPSTGLGAWLSWNPVDFETLETPLSRFLVGVTFSL